MPTRPLLTRYADDLKLFPDRWHWAGIVFFSLLVIVFPMVASDHWLNIANNALIAVVGAVGMMVLTGFAGQVSLGHAAFLAVGAYGAAIFSAELGLPFWLCVPISGLLAALVGLSVGPFALRLEGLYLAIVTIGLMFLVEHVLRNGLDIAYGKDYLSVPMHGFFAEPGSTGLGSFREPLQIGNFRIDADRKLYGVFMFIAALAVWMGKNLQRTNSGRAMMAVRDGELASAALGVDGARAKMTAFGVSSFIAGVA